MGISKQLLRERLKKMGVLLNRTDKGLNLDKHVFQYIMVLTLLFMVVYAIGTSVPAWYVLEERVTNISTCATADRYIATHVRQSWTRGSTKLEITASLWFLNIRLNNGDQLYFKFLPFMYLPRTSSAYGNMDGKTMLVTSILPNGLVTLITCILLSMGVMFSFSASNRPSHLVYYGLSAVLIVSAITTWVSIAVQASEAFILSAAFDFCLQYGEIKTSLLLQSITGASAILAFILAFILIHLAMLINHKVTSMRTNDTDDDAFDVARNWRHMYAADDTVSNLPLLQNKVYQI